MSSVIRIVDDENQITANSESPIMITNDLIILLNISKYF